jgi:hypothetical protein
MRAQQGLTAAGKLSEHTLDGTGERTFLVAEFDFARLTPRESRQSGRHYWTDARRPESRFWT